MKLLFKQRFFSWLDSYDVYDEWGNTVFTVEGQFAWGHKLHILDKNGRHAGTLKEVVLAFLPRFEMYAGEQYIGSIKKEFTFFKPTFTIDVNGWSVEGDFFEWDYAIRDAGNRIVAEVSKELWKLTDTYVIDVAQPEDALRALMVVLAIDAEKCSRN
ncbi:MAG: LURP-one-related family protein [Lachnospiraceae bacterium]|nr:LURP-one-related family protein [Lachnospiraceae bacterium]